MAGGLAAAAGVAGWATLVEPRMLRMRRHELRLPHWPERLDGLRVAVVSDLHAGAPHVGAERVARIARRVDRERPDLVVLLGDFVDEEVAGADPVAPEAVAALLGELRAPLGVLAVLGNHDWITDGERVRTALSGAGIRVLEDEAVRLARAPAELWAAGLADATERSPDVGLALRAVPHDAALIVLSHDPDLFPRVPARASLTLAGHVHGGQVDVPVLKRRWIPSRFGDRYAGGHVVEGGRHLVVSRGVGTSTWPVRLNAPPELLLLTLRPGP